MKKLPHPLSHRLRAQVATATALLAALAATPAAEASMVITYVETDGNVVATGSGSIDTFDLWGGTKTGVYGSGVAPGSQQVYASVGPVDEAETRGATFNGPTSFGAEDVGTIYTNGTGDLFGIIALRSQIILPVDYVSGSALYGTATFLNQNFASLGLYPGTYVWTFGSGEHADSITVQIGPTQANVPEPASIALAGLGLAGLAATRRRKQG